MGNTFNDAISCLKMRIDLYTRSTYTRVYVVLKFLTARDSKKMKHDYVFLKQTNLKNFVPQNF